MKKILFLLAILPMMLACSSSESEEKEKFEFIQLEVNTTSEAKEAYVALYYGWEGNLKSVGFAYQSYNKLLAFANDSSDETIFAITGQYAEDCDIENGKIVHSFYGYQFNNLYGDASQGGQYAIAISIDGETSFKVFNATKNTKVELQHDGTSFKWSTRDY